MIISALTTYKLAKKLITCMEGSSIEQDTRMSTKPHIQALIAINMLIFC